MSERDNAATILEEEDVLTLEKENRELASKQVRQINDTLRKVRRISRESQQGLLPVLEEPQDVNFPLAVQEVVVSRTHDSRRERDDSTDKFLIPEPTLESPVSEVFRKAFEMFERECSQFRFTRGKNSPVVRSWKLV